MWFRGLDEEKKHAMVEVLKGSKMQFERLREIIESLYRTAHSKVETVDSPGWALATAHAEGYKKALRDIYKVLPDQKGNPK